MEITLSQYAGFCEGVGRAYKMAMSLDMKKIKKPVFILGSLVHNPDVNKKVEAKGVKEIGREEFFKSAPGKIGTIIITAHGDGTEVFKFAKKNKIDVIDATCPKVIKVQKLAQVYARRGYKIILVGDKEHKETKGINSWAGGKAIIISGNNDLENIKLGKNEKIVVLSQTTQDEDFFKSVSEFTKNKFPETKIIFTICLTTSQRQGEIKKLAEKNDAVIVIGSPISANSRRLFEIALKINPKTYFIENFGGIKKNWFKEVRKIAITAGASTPEWIIKGVVKRLNKI